jgi:hypothetical protein
MWIKKRARKQKSFFSLSLRLFRKSGSERSRMFVWLDSTVYQMHNRQKGMSINHAWPGKAHDGSYLFAFLWFVTVGGTVEARGFGGIVGALVDPFFRIVCQRSAALAQFTFLMVAAAVHPDHHLDGLVFAAETMILLF